jgi:hypothetical protein
VQNRHKQEQVSNELIADVATNQGSQPSRYFTSTDLMERMYSFYFKGNMELYDDQTSETKAKEFLRLYLLDVRCDLDNEMNDICNKNTSTYSSTHRQTLMGRINQAYGLHFHDSMLPLILRAYRRNFSRTNRIEVCDNSLYIFDDTSEVRRRPSSVLSSTKTSTNVSPPQSPLLLMPKVRFVFRFLKR